MIVEKDCTITHDGRKFTGDGSYFYDARDGYTHGVVYVDESSRQHRVTTWHGQVLAVAELGPIYQGNYCRLRSVLFELKGVLFHGRYCPDTGNAVRVRSTRRVA